MIIKLSHTNTMDLVTSSVDFAHDNDDQKDHTIR